MKPALASTLQVVNEVVEEHRRQDAKWGEQNHPSLCSGALADVFSGHTPVFIVEVAMELPHPEYVKSLVNERLQKQTVGYADIALEEFTEVVEAAALDARDGGNEDRTRTELVQLAAVCVAWVEAIDRRAAKRGGR